MTHASTPEPHRKRHWRSATLPHATALFVVGDVHANDVLLAPLLAAIAAEISALPMATHSHVIFLGDYIDRGPNAPRTIDLLLGFEREMASRKNVSVTFLCGNHDEYFSRFLEHRGIIDAVIDGHAKSRDLIYVVTTEEGALYLAGLESWLFFGGGITMLRDYDPDMDLTLFDKTDRRFRREHPDFSLAKIEALLQGMIAKVPPAHRDFFHRCYVNRYVIVGEYLMTHAGIDPSASLAQLGIGVGTPTLSGKALVDFLMIRNPFLWRESLPHCPYVVVHGHTPSDIPGDASLIADGQKDYRLCVDTASYAPAGGITCFVRHQNDAYFMATNNAAPGYVARYSIPAIGQRNAREFHERAFLQYHQMSADGKFSWI